MIHPASRVVWEAGTPEGWNAHRSQGYIAQVIFELCELPNFASPRFAELGEKLEERKAEVARHQMQMLRQFHGLGNSVTVTLRLRRAGSQLRLFIVACVFDTRPITSATLDALAAWMHPMLPKEYSLVRVTPDKDADTWHYALDVSWARHVEELFKPEDTPSSHLLDYFYVALRWQPQQGNTMEQLCRTLLRFAGEAAVDLMLAPTAFAPIEREWVSGLTQEMREELAGKRLTVEGATKTYPPLPHLQAPLDNYQELLKSYPQNRLFLTTFRVLASADPASITQALMAIATRSPAQIVSLAEESPLFPAAIRAAQEFDLASEVHPLLWGGSGKLPWRAQRLHRLADLDEVTGFWRLPIPLALGFPGFELDTGVGDIRLGTLADDAASEDAPARFEREALAKHGLIVGMPGSGKTTTVFNILHQLWPPDPSKKRVPFMVLEPAKTEYRALRRIEPFGKDLFVFTLGDERISPFRFNPFEVPERIPLESHISRLNACFTGAFDLFDPLPLLLDHAIRRAYEAKGWYDDSMGGEPGLEAPTLADLCYQAQVVARTSGYSDRVRDDFNAALAQRLESLRRGSKGRMLDTRQSLPFNTLMQQPLVLELDALNDDEKALLMMFVLTFVYEYARANRPSGSPLSHVLVIEEAHNLIGRNFSDRSAYRANPKEQAIHLFTRMLAEMRALGEGILIADQLPTALAPEAMKQTNLKVLMRMTAMDDRTEMGNTMDLDEGQLKDVTHFRSGEAYVFLEDWSRVRQVQMTSFKEDHGLNIPQSDDELADEMEFYEQANPELFMPFRECSVGCRQCNRRVRSQAEQFTRTLGTAGPKYLKDQLAVFGGQSVCFALRRWANSEAIKVREKCGKIEAVFPFCAYVHLLHAQTTIFDTCQQKSAECVCRNAGRDEIYRQMLTVGQQVASGGTGPTGIENN